MRQAIYNHVIADSTLMGILTGGLYDAYTVNHISRTTTPDAFVQGELCTCALLKMGDFSPTGPYTHSARQVASFYLYDLLGYSSIVQAREQLYELLHDIKLTPTSPTAGAWHIRWIGDVTQQRDDPLAAALEISRFECLVLRR